MTSQHDPRVIYNGALALAAPGIFGMVWACIPSGNGNDGGGLGLFMICAAYLTIVAIVTGIILAIGATVIAREKSLSNRHASFTRENNEG